MQYTKIEQGDSCTIEMSGKFIFSDHVEFKAVIGILKNQDIKHFMIDIGKVEFIDSAALGLLLLLKDEAEKTGASVVLKRPAGQVKKMFEIARFYEIFKIDG